MDKLKRIIYQLYTDLFCEKNSEPISQVKLDYNLWWKIKVTFFVLRTQKQKVGNVAKVKKVGFYAAPTEKLTKVSAFFIDW